MKIPDASAVFAILSEPGLIDRILRLGHVLAITSHVLENEIINPRTRRAVYDMEREGKITVLYINKREEVEEFMKYHAIGAGESDVLLAYEKMVGAGGSHILHHRREKSHPHGGGVENPARRTCKAVLAHGCETCHDPGRGQAHPPEDKEAGVSDHRRHHRVGMCGAVGGCGLPGFLKGRVWA